VRNRAIDESNLSLQQAVGTLANKCAARHGNRATGQVVSCIAQDLNNLVKDGVISGREKGALQSCAARARGKF
jgi:hypothetical protein